MSHRIIAGAAILLALSPGLASAQTDYYNTDRHRPLRIEDPYPTERYAFDFHVAPLRLTREGAGAYRWRTEPELAYGILPRTHLEIGTPLEWSDDARGRAAGAAGIELSVLHAFNIETAVPAFGVRATVELPAGPFGPETAIPSLQGIVTRTMPWARMHLNAEYTFGDYEVGCPAAVGVECEPEDHSRWLAGLAIDRTFPLEAFLLGAEVFAEQPLEADSDVRWTGGAGIRYQLDPVWTLDAGVSVALSGDVHPWSVTVGVARVFALAWLMPGGGR